METKGTVLIKTDGELLNFIKREECLMNVQIKAVADIDANAIVTGGKVAHRALRYVNNNMLAKLSSKWDLRRIGKTVNTAVLPRLTLPIIEEIGHCDSIYLSEFEDIHVVVFKHEKRRWCHFYCTLRLY